jgi:transposase InsO family protein
MAEPGETIEELGKRIAALYRELSYPSATKFRAALRKRGIVQVSGAFVKDLVADQGARQLSAPPPRFTGHVTARHVDERWASDVMDLSAKTTKGGPAYILIVQDIFSRFLFARAIRTKTEVGAAFSRIMEETNRKPEELNSDRGSEFTSGEFQRMLRRSNIAHRLKMGPQDIATLDRAIGTLRATLSRRTAEGGPWFDELDAAVTSLNGTEHAALFGGEPEEVIGDDDLRFELRYKNAAMTKDNAQQAQKRATRLETVGAFRVLEKPMTGFKRRAGQQNWSEELHVVRETKYGQVTDAEGNSYPMSTVKPVSSTTVAVAAPAFAKGGSTRITERRQIALRPWLATLLGHIRRAGEGGLSIHMAGKLMAAQQGFTPALREQRATLPQMVALFPESIRVEKQKGHIVLFVQEGVPQPRAGTLDAFAG